MSEEARIGAVSFWTEQLHLLIQRKYTKDDDLIVGIDELVNFALQNARQEVSKFGEEIAREFSALNISDKDTPRFSAFFPDGITFMVMTSPKP